MINTSVETVNALSPEPGIIAKAASVLAAGGLVAFPTETVYGLGADGLSELACRKIFLAKGRPADNPLILHLSDTEGIEALCTHVSDVAREAICMFAPGPLTFVLPKSCIVPDAVSAGLPTVAVRIPSHPVAHALIKACGFPIAAPSANRSGRPSPTCTAHVLSDLDGRIDLILDGGVSSVGLESTVVSFAERVPTLLRPGGVTLEDLRSVLGRVDVDPTVVAASFAGRAPTAPGMKYRHYAPIAPLILISGKHENALSHMVGKQDQGRVGILCYAGEEPLFSRAAHVVALGSFGDSVSQAQNIFSALRCFDEAALDCILAYLPEEDGLGLAVRNRLLKAAGHEVIEV